jgi:hypothetical protein
MLAAGLRFPNTYQDAREVIENILSNDSSKVAIRTYGMFLSSPCDVAFYHIEESEDLEGYANLNLILTYKVSMLVPTKSYYSTVEKTRNLKVLSAIGDNLWTYRMIDKVWEGDYPSTVAVDTDTGDVFFFSIKLNRLELIEFGQFSSSEFEAFKLEVHDREPFRIILDSDAMFDYIDGAEGIRYLKRNVAIQFNCGIPIVVRAKRPNTAFHEDKDSDNLTV